MKFHIGPRRRKFRNVKTVIDGITFDSKAEGNRYVDLKRLLNAGVISDLRHQVSYELVPKQKGERACNYVADFVYVHHVDGVAYTVVEDVKGVKTPEYVIKRKLMLLRHGIRISEVNVRRNKRRVSPGGAGGAGGGEC